MITGITTGGGIGGGVGGVKGPGSIVPGSAPPGIGPLPIIGSPYYDPYNPTNYR